jgi:hypothetical protein
MLILNSARDRRKKLTVRGVVRQRNYGGGGETAGQRRREALGGRRKMDKEETLARR